MLFDSDCFPSNLWVIDAVNYSIKKLVADLKLSILNMEDFWMTSFTQMS